MGVGDCKIAIFQQEYCKNYMRGDRRQNATRLELLLQQRIDLGSFLPIVIFHLRLLRSLLVEDGLIGFGQFGSLLPADGRGVMRLVPLTERRGVDGDDGVLDEGLGSDQLVVAGVVDGVDDTSLASDRLRSPGEVTGVQSQGSSLDVSSSDADQMNAIAADLGHRGGTTHFVLSLLLVGRPLSSGLPLLVPFCL